jgi:hypothetical protein
MTKDRYDRLKAFHQHLNRRMRRGELIHKAGAFDQLSADEIEKKMIARGKYNITNPNTTLKRSISAFDKVKAAKALASAIISGRIVSKERQLKRLTICSQCTMLSIIDGSPACGICGCQLKARDRSLLNLISLEETADYGCKYAGGSRWKKESV